MHYDAIIVGGGLGGSALAFELARAGHRVLVLERETRFKDRVRGESMLPWGVDIARRLGLVDVLVKAGGHQPRYWINYTEGDPVSRRDMQTTTPHGELSLNIYHPQMQEALMERARTAGAEVKRGATVVGVAAAPDRPPAVTFDLDGVRETLSARVVVGADGRDSQMRAWAGFEVNRDPEYLIIAGALIAGSSVPDGAVHLMFGPPGVVLIAPLGGGRARIYFIYRGVAQRLTLSGKNKVPAFIQLCKSTGTPESWLAGAEVAGPLAEFQGADRWVTSPVKNGVALIGDAAASTDPSWGCGLSLTVLDVERLSGALRASDAWSEGLACYAAQHNEYRAALHRVLEWMTDLMWTPGPEAEERRQRVFPRLLSDPRGFPDAVGLGPFGPNDEQARRLLLGLD